MAGAGFKHIGTPGQDRTKRVIAVETTLEEATRWRGSPAARIDDHQRLRRRVSLKKGPAVCASDRICQQPAPSRCCCPASASELRTRPLPDGSECCDYAAEKRIAWCSSRMAADGHRPQIRDAAKRVNRANFTVMYDPGNIYYYSQGRIDPVEDVKAVAGLVTGVSVKDYLPPDNVALTPGTGKVDFPALFAELRRGGLEGGPLMIEMVKPGDPAQRSKNQESQAIRGAVDRAQPDRESSQPGMHHSKQGAPTMHRLSRCSFSCMTLIDRCGRWRRRRHPEAQRRRLSGDLVHARAIYGRALWQGAVERVLD